MSSQICDVRLKQLFEKQFGDGLVVFVYQHAYVLQQGLAALVRGTDSASIAIAAAESAANAGIIRDNATMLKTRTACVSAAELTAALQRSEARLVWPPTVTLVLVVRANAAAPARVFGGEGQYGALIADMTRQHAATAGNHRVAALLVAICADPVQSARRVAPAALADSWRRQSHWAFVAHAAYVSDLRARSAEANVAYFKWLPALPKLPFDIPTLAVDAAPSPQLVAARSASSTKAPTVAWSLLLAVTGVDLHTLMSADGGSSLFAQASPAVADQRVAAGSLRLWRAAPFASPEAIGADCVVAVNVDVWSEQAAAWRLAAVLDLPARVVASADNGARVARASLALVGDSPLFVPPDIDVGDYVEAAAAAGGGSSPGGGRGATSVTAQRFREAGLMAQRLSITRALDIDVPIVDQRQTAIDLAAASISSSPARRVAMADAAVKSVAQRLPSDAPELRVLADLSRMIEQIESSSDNGRALLEERQRELLLAAETRAAAIERADIDFRRVMQRHHELSRTDRTVKCLLPFYSAVLDLRSLRAAARGWSLYWASDDVRTRSDKLVARPLAVLGREKVGKSWLVAKLSGSALPDEKLHTMGLCVQMMHGGNGGGVESLSVPFIVFDVAGDGVAVRPELEQDQRATESFLRRVAPSMSDGAVLYLCNKFDNTVQAEIDALYEESRARAPDVSDDDLNVIVVHNVLTIGSAHALQQYKLELLRLLSLSAAVVEFDDSDDIKLTSSTTSVAPGAMPLTRSIASLTTGDPNPSIMYINGQKHVFFVSEVGGALANGLSDRSWCVDYNARMTRTLSQYLTRHVPVVRNYGLRERLLATLRKYLPYYWQDHEQFRLTIESAADVVVERDLASGIAATTMLHDVITVHGLNGEPVSTDRLMSLRPLPRAQSRHSGDSALLRGVARIEQRFGGAHDWAHVRVELAGRSEAALSNGDVQFETTHFNGVCEFRVKASATGGGEFGALHGGVFAWECPATHELPRIAASQWATLTHVRVHSESDSGANQFACSLTDGMLAVFVRLTRKQVQ